MMIGGRVGLDIGNFAYDPALPAGFTGSSVTGLLIGGQLEAWYSEMWALSVQLLYDQKGTHIDYSSGVSGFTLSGSDDAVFGYLEVPVLAKVAFGSGDFKPYLFAGPSIGILLSATSRNNGTSTDVDSNFNTLDLAALVGAGVSYKPGGGPTLFLDAGYAIGLINILKNGTSPSGGSESEKTNDIRIAAGILFPLN